MYYRRVVYTLTLSGEAQLERVNHLRGNEAQS